MAHRKVVTADRIYSAGATHSEWGLLIDDGIIEAVGPVAELDTNDASVTELGGRLLVPGTVSSHTHSFQYLLRGFGDDLPFLEWRSRGLYKYSLDLGTDGLYVGAKLCFAELARHGVTTVVDFFYVNASANDNANAVIRAARELGLRIVLARCFYDWDGAPESYRETIDAAVANYEALREAWKDDDAVTIQPAPHSIHGASDDMIRAAVEVAKSHNVPMHMHIAEEKYQVDDCLQAHGKTPLRYLEDLGVLDTRLVCVHGCWLDEEEIRMLGSAGASLAYNPSSNMFLADGVTPIPKMVDAGVTVTLGVDGGCSNNQGSIFGEMRLCALLQKVDTLDATCVTAEQAFDFGTRNAASALGLPIGKLEAGSRADFVALDLHDLSLAPVSHVMKNVVYAQSPKAIREVWVDGEAIWKDGDLVHTTERSVSEEVARLTTDWR